jgi:cbb3-type cytochrome oxidase subunit 3
MRKNTAIALVIVSLVVVYTLYNHRESYAGYGSSLASGAVNAGFSNAVKSKTTWGWVAFGLIVLGVLIWAARASMKPAVPAV